MVPKSNTAQAENRHINSAAADERVSTVVPAEVRLDGPVESPARELQLQLEKSWATPLAERRWSARRRLGFILMTNALLWVTFIWGVTKLV